MPKVEVYRGYDIWRNYLGYYQIFSPEGKQVASKEGITGMSRVRKLVNDHIKEKEQKEL